MENILRSIFQMVSKTLSVLLFLSAVPFAAGQGTYQPCSSCSTGCPSKCSRSASSSHTASSTDASKGKNETPTIQPSAPVGNYPAPVYGPDYIKTLGSTESTANTESDDVAASIKGDKRDTESDDVAASIKEERVPRIAALSWYMMPCIDGVTEKLCNVLKDANDLVERVEAEKKSGVDDSDFIGDWVAKVRDDRYIFVSLKQIADEEAVVEAIIDLQRKAIAVVQRKLESQIQQSKPFDWDTEEAKEAKRVAVTRHSHAVQTMVRNALEDASSNVRTEGINDGSGRVSFHAGPAYQQLVDISQSGWGNN
jgi:hypothetical protein